MKAHTNLEFKRTKSTSKASAVEVVLHDDLPNTNEGNPPPTCGYWSINKLMMVAHLRGEIPSAITKTGLPLTRSKCAAHDMRAAAQPTCAGGRVGAVELI